VIVPTEIWTPRLSSTKPLLQWQNVYNETDLYKAAIRLYTKPLFSWRKALAASSDQRTLYDFARHGLQNLALLHRRLQERTFHYRPGIALRHCFNGKARTLYVYPWEERLIDVMLYRLLTRRLNPWFSPHSYAYRDRHMDLHLCQRRVSKLLLKLPAPLFVLKRDVSDYFGSIDHEKLAQQLARIVDPRDYLYSLLLQRIRFSYLESGIPKAATVGVPFGTAIACVFANIYLTDLDAAMARIPQLVYFRYSDDILAVSAEPGPIQQAAELVRATFTELKLRSKPSQHHTWKVAHVAESRAEPGFENVDRFRHLGLEFRADRSVGLSRDKSRKIQNLFRYNFRRKKRMFARLPDSDQRAALAIRLAQDTLQRGVRNVALIDYYLRHATDLRQWRRLDRWLAEEVLSLTFGGGHRRGFFARLPFQELRRRGLPSFVHRRRLILHGHIDTPFFIWKNRQQERGSRGAAARAGSEVSGIRLFSPIPKAPAGTHS